VGNRQKPFDEGHDLGIHAHEYAWFSALNGPNNDLSGFFWRESKQLFNGRQAFSSVLPGQTLGEPGVSGNRRGDAAWMDGRDTDWGALQFVPVNMSESERTPG